jgi:hypothetical protein
VWDSERTPSERPGIVISVAQDAQTDAVADAEHRPRDDHHLRSVNAITTYRVQASDGEIGYVQDLLIHEATWAIRYLIVNTGHWRVGHKVLIAPPWIAAVRWDDNTLSVALDQEAVRNAPAYAPHTSLPRDEEERIHRHYGRLGYWAEEVKQENPEFGDLASADKSRIDTPTAASARYVG